MAKYDVVVIGGGPGGLFNAAILAKNGKKVLLVEKDEHLGGRAAEFPHKGHRLHLGWHHMCDTGTGMTRVFEHMGKTLDHGLSTEGIPLYIDGKWTSMQEHLGSGRDDFKKIIKEIVNDISWDDIDKYDDQPIRPWIQKRTSNKAVLDLFEVEAIYEGMTLNWWDHSLSESLFMRKLHFTEKRMAAYCWFPPGGLMTMWNTLADAIRENGGEIRLNTPAKDVLIENGRVVGVEVETEPPIMATDYPPTEIIETPCVVSTLPCWDALSIVDEELIPGWYVEQIKDLSREEMRSIWLGLYVALPEPLYVNVEREAPGWFQGPRTGLFGMCTDFTALEKTMSPPGERLITSMACIDHKHLKSRQVINKLFDDFEKENEDMFPVFKKRLWTERHIIKNPSYAPLWKPGKVGRYRPDVEVPAVDGLYFAGDTFRGRSIGCDKPARIAMTVTEKILAKRISDFKDCWHYK